jgi:hypothetical protein
MLTIDLLFAVLLGAAATDAPGVSVPSSDSASRAADAQRISAVTQAASPGHAERRITLIAAAADAHACVFRDAENKLERYVEGAAVEPEWRVTRIDADGATLTSARLLGGKAVSIRLRVNEAIDLADESATIAVLSTPSAEPRRTQVFPQKRRSENNR